MIGSHLSSTTRKSASAAMKPASKAVMLGGSGSGISSPSASQSPHNKMSETNRGKKRGMKSKPLAKAPRPHKRFCQLDMSGHVPRDPSLCEVGTGRPFPGLEQEQDSCWGVDEGCFLGWRRDSVSQVCCGSVEYMYSTYTCFRVVWA